MAATTTPIVLTGAVTMLSEYMQGKGVDYKVALATGIAAGIFGLVERTDPALFAGIAWIAFVSSLIVPRKDGSSPVEVFLTKWQAVK